MVYLPHSLVAPVELASYPYASKLQRYAAIGIYDFLERDCLRMSGVTIRFTQAAAQAFSSRYGARLSARIKVIPMPIDAPDGPTTAHISPLRLLNVGRLIPSKNVGFIIDLLARRAELAWHLDIVGSGPELGALQAAAAAAALHDRITFHGHLDDVADIYRNADVFLFPSLLENSPVVLLEAMSNGLTTLSFYPDGVRYQGANNEMVEHAVTGLLARDEQQFETLLVSLLHGDYDLTALGTAAKDAVLSRNSWPEHVAQIETMISPLGEKESA